ncbi:MAG: RNA-binding protein [Rhodospirillaceae bacterium]
MKPIELNKEDPDGQDAELRDPRDPLRRCIVTGTVQPRVDMIRFVLGPDGMVVPDLENSLPGRGLWLTAERATVERAVSRNFFARAARRSARIEAGLADRLEMLLERRCLNLVGLARRAGQAIAGFEKVRESLKTGRVGRDGPPGLLLAARDGSEDGRSKLRALAGDLPLIEEFEASALGAALGRDNAVHALLARGRLADRLRVDAGRLKGLRKTIPVGHRPAGQPLNDGPVGHQ